MPKLTARQIRNRTMAYEPKNNSGTLFKNDKKQSDKHPDYKGDCMIDGEKFWMSAWIKKGNKGTFMSFSFTPKEGGSGDNKSRSRSSSSDEDDVPF